MSVTLKMLASRLASPPRAGLLAAAFVWALALSAPVPAHAQGEPPAAGTQEDAPEPRRSRRDRPNLLASLNLTPEQFEQLREIRRQSDAAARDLGRRLRLARRALDEAIYADALDEAAVEQHAHEVAAAQEALIRLRAQTELRIRRVLTSEQLQSFRQLRQRARGRQRGPGGATAIPLHRERRRPR